MTVSNAFPLLPALAAIFAGVLRATWNAPAKAATDRGAAFALIGIGRTADLFGPRHPDTST
ncbi:hypothetical protein AB0L00_12195 [Actinoallomurus sp. NPDC052308]|uniref:hypothetical protein n=1 Tax=Actinoallomurus sp. NPDC052308 TaxID=3155530 RepID=UPI00342A591C